MFAMIHRWWALVVWAIAIIVMAVNVYFIIDIVVSGYEYNIIVTEWSPNIVPPLIRML